MRKRFYILFVARDDDGQLRKIPIPVHYLYIFVVGAAIGFLSLTGIASSYARMLLKVSSYNQLRTEKEDFKTPLLAPGAGRQRARRAGCLVGIAGE